MRRKTKYRSIDAISIIKYKILRSSFNRIVTEKSKKMSILKKRNGYQIYQFVSSIEIYQCASGNK